MGTKRTIHEAGQVIPFDFGQVAEFTAPKSIESSIHPALTPYCLQPFGGYLATISSGRVWGESGAVLSPEGKLIFDLSQEYDAVQNRMLEAEEHPVFHRWNDPKLQYLEGTVAVLTFCGSHNYFHWLYDVLPRLAMLKTSGIPYTSIIMNPNPYGPFVEQTWAMLGISESSVIRTNPEAYFEADQLLVPSLMMNSHYPRGPRIRYVNYYCLTGNQHSLHLSVFIFLETKQAPGVWLMKRKLYAALKNIAFNLFILRIGRLPSKSSYSLRQR